MLTIYSIGDFNLLVTVLNAVAAMTEVNQTLGLSKLIAVGFLLGAMLTVLRAIISGKLELQYLIIGWLGFMIMFGVKTPNPINVEDVYTGASIPVANVPIGIAAIGAITSGVGYGLTQTFETAFALPSLTGNGYLEALSVLMMVRGQGAGTANSEADGGGGPTFVGDVERSLVNYIKDCVIYDIEMGLASQEVSMESLLMSPDLWDTMEINSSVWTTVTYIPGVDPETGGTKTCTEAYSELDTYLIATFLPNWTAYLAEVSGINDPQARTQAALDSMVVGGLDANKYMINAFLSNVVREADLSRSSDIGANTAVLIKTQAMEQRHIQWATQQSLFMEAARPLMAFVESFIYAVAPIMAFLITLGAIGISILSKYLMVMIWIQLWAPVLAISNLYINMAASAKLSGIQAVVDVSSMRGLESVYTEASSYLAMGGMLAAATPVIAFFLVSGSTAGLSSLASGLSQANINSKLAAPDLQNDSTVQSVQLGSNYTDAQGRTTAGSASTFSSLSFGETSRTDKQSAKDEVYTSQQSFMDSYGVSASQRFSFGDGGGVSELMSSQQRASGSLSNGVTKEHASSIAEQFGIRDTEQSGLIQGMLGARLAGNKGAAAALFSSLQATQSVGKEKAQQIQSAVDNRVSGNTGFRAEYANALAKDVMNKTDTTYSSAEDGGNNAELRKSASDVLTSTERFSQAESNSESIGSNLSLTSAEFGQKVKKSETGMALAGLVEKNDSYDEVKRMMGSTEMQNIEDPQQRLAAAQGLALFHGSRESRQDLAEFVANDLKLGTPSNVGDAHKYEGVSPGVENDGAVMNAVEEGVGPKLDVGEHTGNVKTEMGKREAAVQIAQKDGDGQVMDKFNTATDAAAGKLEQHQQENHALIKPVLDQLMKEQEEALMPTAGDFSNIPSRVGQFIDQADAAGAYANDAMQLMKDNGDLDNYSMFQKDELQGNFANAGWNKYGQERYEQKLEEAKDLNPEEAEYYALSSSSFRGKQEEVADSRLAELETQLEPHRMAQIDQAVSEGRPELLKIAAEADYDSHMSEQRREHDFTYINKGDESRQE